MMPVPCRIDSVLTDPIRHLSISITERCRAHRAPLQKAEEWE